jgi:hypothetical protein
MPPASGYIIPGRYYSILRKAEFAMQVEPLISDHFMGILGLIVGVVGVIVGAIGTFVALRSDGKMKTAQQAQRRVEQKLLRHMATRTLETLTENALAIMAKIKRREWGDVAESAENLGQRVVEIRGAWSHVLEPLEKDKLDAAAMNIQQFIDSAPTAAPEPQPSEQDVQVMLVRCRRLAEISSEVAGCLSVELMQHTED